MQLVNSLYNRHSNKYSLLPVTDLDEVVISNDCNQKESNQDQKVQNYIFKECSIISKDLHLEIISYLSLKDRHSYMLTNKFNAIIGALFQKCLLASAFPEHRNLIQLLYSEHRDDTSGISFSSKLRRVSKIIEKQSVSSRFWVRETKELIDWKRMSLRVFRKSERAFCFLEQKD